MALPSQSARGTPMTRSHMHRRRRWRLGRLVVGVVVLAGIGAAGWAGWNMVFAGPKAAMADNAAPASGEHRAAERGQGDGNTRRPSNEAAPAGRTAEPEPVVKIQMERGVVEAPQSEPPRQEPPRRETSSQPQGEAIHPSIAAAESKVRENDLVAARDLLNTALGEPSVPEAAKAEIRARMQALNDDILFSPKVHTREPNTRAYVVVSGDSLVRIASRERLMVHPKLIARVNRLSRPDVIFQGQGLKLVQGPFHAIVHKGAFRLDLYVGPAGEPQSWTYVRSFRVGLGEGDSTPVGEFVVRRNSKLENPAWVNPRTGEKFDANDPKNPIGEHWIGLDGIGEHAVHTGYGLHGTIEPDSIGQMRSMGCVRLLAGDIEFLYELLEEGVSQVSIRP